MKPFASYLVPLGILLFLALSLVPSGTAQQSPPTPIPLQIGFTWPAQGAGAGSFGAIDVTGKLYFAVDWVVSGTVATCTVTLDGATSRGGTFNTGSIISAQSCTSSGSFTTSAATENVQAQLTYSITGTGSVTFTVRGSSQSGSGPSVTISSPVDGSGFVNVDCKTGCSGSNPNGQATMANSAPVVIASDQSAIATKAAGPALVSAAWTSATANNTALQLNLSGNYNSLNVYLNQGTTLTGGTVTFEGSDTTAFTNAYPVQCVFTNNGTTGSSYTLVASTNQALDCDISALVAFRVRLSPQITGTGTVNVSISASSEPSTPDVSVQQATSPWLDNVTQFGSNNVVTGTGASGVGIPRVTIANDSSLAANQSVNLNQVAGAAPSATNPLFVGIADGTNGAAAVKAASTSAAAADKSLVVQLSPNQPNLTTPLNTQPAGFASLVAFQQAVTASAVVLASNATHGFCVKALPTNAITVFIGPTGVTTGTGYPLAAGDSVCYQLSNTNLAFVIASTTGASVAVTGN
jgi:hypothetical protein